MIPCCVCGRSEITKQSFGAVDEHKHKADVTSILCSLCGNLLLNQKEAIVPWEGLLKLKEERERRENERENPTIRRHKRRG